ncbi:1-phosphofructokinase [Microaceticoccus formicicus]|uniref:1-phosphofructokinase n=1 Tax=Microaceticoccus formicicus TaxID=3118105 RepID=UPI003CD039B6|nr:1-phosphofructokinase [Peptoniphilaceae bacterium AMB_02]
MITTLSLNPSLDYIVDIEDFNIGKINRTKSEYMLPGGKGLNVSQVLKNLGMASTALGFVAGFTGRELTRMLDEQNISNKMIEVENGFTRINLKVRGDIETAVNGMGPIVTDEDFKKVIIELEKLTEGDVLILSGNIARNMKEDSYRLIMDKVPDSVKVIVDATKEQLMSVADLKPFLIKPNHEELGELFNVEIKDKKTAGKYARLLQEKGFRNILVSMGGDGAVMLTETGDEYHANAPVGKLVNSVGAGDSMVAGFIYGYLELADYTEAFRYGIAAGSASAFSENLGTGEEIMNLLSQIKIGLVEEKQ